MIKIITSVIVSAVLAGAAGWFGRDYLAPQVVTVATTEAQCPLPTACPAVVVQCPTPATDTITPAMRHFARPQHLSTGGSKGW